jgi:hypothetical protein
MSDFTPSEADMITAPPRSTVYLVIIAALTSACADPTDVHAPSEAARSEVQSTRLEVPTDQPGTQDCYIGPTQSALEILLPAEPRELGDADQLPIQIVNHRGLAGVGSLTASSLSQDGEHTTQIDVPITGTAIQTLTVPRGAISRWQGDLDVAGEFTLGLTAQFTDAGVATARTNRRWFHYDRDRLVLYGDETKRTQYHGGRISAQARQQLGVLASDQTSIVPAIAVKLSDSPYYLPGVGE